MKRRTIILCLTFFVHASVYAESTKVDGITWSYSIVDGNAVIGDSATYNSCVDYYYTSGFVSIPAKMGGKQLIRVGEYAFIYCNNITGIEIPVGVQAIGSRAFWDCRGLAEVYIPPTVKISGNQAFKYCSALDKVFINSLEDWCKIDFDTTTSNPLWYAGKLYLNDILQTELEIPHGVSEIKAYAFNTKSACPIGRIVIPSSVAKIGKDAFLGCSSVTNIVFMGNAPSYLDSSAFSGVGASCIIYVAPVSQGWGVDIPGELYDVRIEYWPDALKHVFDPVIEPDSSIFTNASQEVSIRCVTEGATILYTTDGSNPLENGLTYRHPFAIYKTSMVRAVAVKSGWESSAEVNSILTREESMSAALGLFRYTMETDEVAPWVVDGEVSHDGISSVRSGAIGNNEMTYLQASVRKAGTVSFWWKAQCEEAEIEDNETYWYDYCAFLVDGVVKARIAGHDAGWQYVSLDVAGGGKHTLRWEYSKDGATSYSPDCVWLDQVQWVPADGSGFTMTSPEQVPYSWLSNYGFGGMDVDFETAANAPSGKRDGSGKVTSVWEEWVAGTDPTNETSRFSAKIEVRDGLAVLMWEPDLNESGTKSERLYKIYGKENLSDADWVYPTNSLHRFFKVTVEMP